MPQIFAGILAGMGVSTAAIFTVGTFTLSLAQIGGFILYSIATSFLLKALTPSIDTSKGRGIYTNAREATGPHAVIYGQVRVSGPITYIETVNNNERMITVMPLAGHEVEEIGDIYLNDKVVTLDGSGWVTDSEWLGAGGNSKIMIRKHLGTAAQTADSHLLAITEDVNVDSNFRGRGIAYLLVKMIYNQDVFAQGVPTISAVVKGRKLLDPRTDLTAYSNNAALVIHDYVTNEHGLNAAVTEFDTGIDAEADICDEAVTLAAGGTQARYTIDGVFHRDAPPARVLPELLSACAGSLYWSQGWKLKVGAYRAPTITLTEDDLRSPIEISTRVSNRERINGIRGVYVSAEDNWIRKDLPPLEPAAFLTEDNSVPSIADIALPFTTNFARGQRIQKILLYRAREQISIRAEFSRRNAFNLSVGDTVNLTLSRYSWTAKVFEVMRWRLRRAKNGDLLIELVLQETSSDVYAWSAEETSATDNATAIARLALPSIDETTEVTFS